MRTLEELEAEITKVEARLNRLRDAVSATRGRLQSLKLEAKFLSLSYEEKKALLDSLRLMAERNKNDEC